MPTYRDVSVQVTDSTNTPLTEYGIRKLDRAQLSSCYIQSKTDMPFRILIKPDDRLFPDFEEEQEDSEDDIDRLIKREEVDEYGRDLSKRSSAPYTSSQAYKSSVRKALPSPSPPPEAAWHLLATLRLDGRKQYEKRSIVYLDRNHPNFDIANGEILMKFRIIRDAEGNLRECGWLFREVGIETVFDTLLLSGEKDTVPAHDEDDLLTAFGGLGTNGLEDAEEKSTVGQIEITLERVVVGETEDDIWVPDLSQDQDMGLSPNEVSSMSHTAARDLGRRKKASGASTIFYEYVDRKEKPYATFKFYYRGEEKLRKLGFLQPSASNPANSPVVTIRKRKDALNKAATAPLSIMRPKPEKYVFNDKGELVAVEDIPPLSLTKSEDKNKSPPEGDRTLTDKKIWQPKNHLLPSINVENGSSLDGIDSPPDSPTMDEDSENTITLSSPIGKPFTPTTTSFAEAEQSSADESSPLKHKTSSDLNFHTGKHMTAFRNLTSTHIMDEGEEADDEASDGTHTPNSMGFTTDNGSKVGDEDDNGGVSQNKPDGGLGEKLGELTLRKRAGDGGAEEEEKGSVEFKKVCKDESKAMPTGGEELLSEGQVDMEQQLGDFLRDDESGKERAYADEMLSPEDLERIRREHEEEL